MWTPSKAIKVRVKWSRFKAAEYRRADALRGAPLDGAPCGGASPCCAIGGGCACGRDDWYDGTIGEDEGPAISYAVAVRDYNPPRGSGHLPLKKGAEIKHLEWTGSTWAGELDDANEDGEASSGIVLPEYVYAEGTYRVRMNAYVWTDSIYAGGNKTLGLLLAPLDIITRLCYVIVESTVFNAFIIALIIINTAVLAMDRYPADHGMVYVLDIVNFVLTTCFTVEVVLKSIGLGFRQYLRGRQNIRPMMGTAASSGPKKAARVAGGAAERPDDPPGQHPGGRDKRGSEFLAGGFRLDDGDDMNAKSTGHDTSFAPGEEAPGAMKTRKDARTKQQLPAEPSAMRRQVSHFSVKSARC